MVEFFEKSRNIFAVCLTNGDRESVELFYLFYDLEIGVLYNTLSMMLYLYLSSSLALKTISNGLFSRFLNEAVSGDFFSTVLLNK